MRNRNHVRGAAEIVLVGIKTARKWAKFNNQKKFSSAATALKLRSWFEKSPGEDAWKKIESGETDLKYWDLEVVEKLTGIPTGVLLVSTHFTSFIRSNKPDDALKFVHGLAHLARYFEERLIAETPLMLATKDNQKAFLREVFELWKARGYYAPELLRKIPPNVTLHTD